MAITENTYTGDGSTVLFSFTFEYIAESDIKITLDGTPTTAYTLANATTIQFNTAPANGVGIRIYRDTNIDTLSAQFFPGSAIRAEDLNNNFTQNLYVTQEVNNNAVQSDDSVPFVNDISMGGYKITNLADPVASSDAATRSFVEQSLSSEFPIFYRRWSKTAAGGETSLSGTDDNGISLSYVAGSEKVFINGALQVRGVDYTGTTGTTLTGIPALTAGDIVEVHSSSNYTVATLPEGSITNANVDGGAAIQSTKLAFTQSGTGAATRTVESKLRDVVSVKDFGAVGDGVTDDTAAIQAALASGAKKIVFPDGTYLLNSITEGLVINSNTTVSGYGATIKNTAFQSPSTVTAAGDALHCGLIIEMGSENIIIEGLTLEGPSPLSIDQSDMCFNSIGINIRGLFDRWYIDGVDDSTTGTSKNITVRDCTVYGWHQSGILADYVDNLLIESNNVHTCGRDGIRVYGCSVFEITRNRVNNITPGTLGIGNAPNYNCYGIAATRVYRSESGDGSVNLYRRSQDGLITHNRVTQVPTWKGLDTHGGERLTFSHNYVYGCYIAVGLAIGGQSVAQGYVPLRDITVAFNELRQDQANFASYGNKSAITVYADSWNDDNRGLDINIIGNTIDGYGASDNSGGIQISNMRGVLVKDNRLKNCLACGITFINDNDEIYLAGNRIQDVVLDDGVCRGIQVQPGFIHNIFIESGQFYQTPGGDTMTAIYSTNDDSGTLAGLRVQADIQYEGNVTPLSAPAFINDASLNHYVPIAWANVDVSGGVSTIRSSQGVASVAWTATGKTDITLLESVVSNSLTCGIATARQALDITCQSVPVSSTVWNVSTYLGGTLSDRSFCWVLYGLRST